MMTRWHPNLLPELKRHQERVVLRMLDDAQPGLVVAHGLGSGKTLTSIALQEALELPADIVVPASLMSNYEKEVTKHVEHPNLLRCIQSMQAVTRRRDLLERALLIMDEAHRSREATAVTFKNLFRNRAKKRVCLTASPFYNSPADLAPLINIASGEVIFPNKLEDFEVLYVHDEIIQPTWYERSVYHAKPYVVRSLKASERSFLRTVYEHWVDYHPNNTDEFPSVRRIDFNVQMTPEQQQKHDDAFGTAPGWMRFFMSRLAQPMGREASALNSFMSKTRQLCNVVPGAGKAPKFETAVAQLMRHLSGPHGKALVYSNFLASGVEPYEKLLKARNVAYRIYTGETSREDRDAMVAAFNADQIQVLLVSSAAGEGLDLKGCRLVQILEPHWNLEKIRQVEGRAIRFRSHTHLPADEQNVTIQRFITTRCSGPGITTDEYMAKMSDDKEALIEEFRQLLPRRS
jgi:SNF2 family DNA or RNA helicase